jgi:hypothetical protein
LGVVANDVTPRNGFHRYSYGAAGLAPTPFADQQLVLRRRRRPAGTTDSLERPSNVAAREREILAGIIEPDWSTEPA